MTMAETYLLLSNRSLCAWLSLLAVFLFYNDVALRLSLFIFKIPQQKAQCTQATYFLKLVLGNSSSSR